MNRYVVLTNTPLFTGTWEGDWIKTINDMIDMGYIPLGGTVYFGNSGLMQTMYLPEGAGA